LLNIMSMKSVIIVSKCSRIIKLNEAEFIFEFHFRGACAGEILNKIRLRGSGQLGIKRSEEYLLYVKVISVSRGLLEGSILKHKPLSECFDKS
jgi:hypothetical protein